MKQFIVIPAILFSSLIYAQVPNKNSNPTPIIVPANTPPLMPISPSAKTTIISQPQSMPGSNMNPITGTVISLKENKKATVLDEPIPTKPVVNKRSKTPVKKNKKHKNNI